MTGSRTSRELRRALLLLSWLVPCSAGPYNSTRWDSRDLFPGGEINAIAQTPDGYLWIGAENGLVRFDGVSFRLLDHTNSPSLPFGRILGLAVDPEGALWVRMESPNLLRYRGGSFEQMYYVERQERGVTAIARGTGGILIAANNAPQLYADGKFTPIVSSARAGGLPMSIAETGDGAVCMGLVAGLFCVRDGRGSHVAGLADQKVNVLRAGVGPELWIGTDSGLVRWDGSSINNRGIPAALTHIAILALERDHDSNLWISTATGIARLDSNGALIQLPAASAPGMVRAIFEDREGDLWLGGPEGLAQLRRSPFLSYDRSAGEGGSVYVDASGRAWTGPSSGGLISIRGADHHPVTGLGLEKDVIYSISGGAGEIWLGRKDGGVTQLRPVAQSRARQQAGSGFAQQPQLREEDGDLEQRTYTAADGLAPGAVYAVYRSRDGTVWAGTLSGAVSRIRKDRVNTFTTADGLGADAVSSIEETPDGVIWVGTAGGLDAFRGGAWKRYGGVDGLPPGRVNTLAVDPNGVLWIGSAAGLLYWSGTRIETARNVPDWLQGEIYGLAADDAGNLWAATDRRVVRISRASLLSRSKDPVAVREFGAADGLPSTRGIRRDHSVSKDASGRIWFSLEGGISVMNSAHPASLAPALVNLESAAVDGRPLGAGLAARYSSSHQRVAFNFIGLSLAGPARVRYRYMLDGYDRDWSQPTESREAAYTNLPPASYIFRVMASNSEGLWNGSPVVVPFEVEPQLWQTWWFRLSALGLAAAVIFASFRYRIARAHAALNSRFEQRLLERTRIARELHDTLLQSFQGLMLHLQVVDDMLPPGKAKDQLAQTLDRADRAIAEGRHAVYDLRSSTATGHDLAEALRAAASEFAGDGSTAFRLDVEGAARDLHPIPRDDIYRIACEGLRNAFKHAHARHIEAEITYAERLFRFRIRDDGQGIPPDILESGRTGHYGMRGMRERARECGGNLEIWSRAGTGTEIDFTVPGSIAYTRQRRRSVWRLFRRNSGH